jgi:predicted  nucleic acid-binding Zn-ribbon protein
MTPSPSLAPLTCAHVTKPWVEALDQAQREIERLENEIKDLRDAYEHKAGKQLGQ